MKKILIAIPAMLVLAFALLSCNSNSPKTVASTFLTSFYHMDYEAAKKVSTDETKKSLEALQSLSSMLPDSTKQEVKQITVTIKDVKENGDKASVTYITSKTPQEQTLKLVKQNGKWLSAWSKADAMGGDDNAGAGDNTPAGSDSSMAAPADNSAASDTSKKK